MSTPTPPNTTPSTWEEALERITSQDYFMKGLRRSIPPGLLKQFAQSMWNARAALDRVRIEELEKTLERYIASRDHLGTLLSECEAKLRQLQEQGS